VLETLLQPNDREERCGLVLSDGTTVEIPNIANNPVTSYEMDPEKALPYLTAGSVVGTWHTHPASSPDLSGEDYRGFSGWPKLKHHIIGVVDGQTVVKSYEIKNGAILECA
jgi:proteasome lid subunit RPN8/RPN11